MSHDLIAAVLGLATALLTHVTLRVVIDLRRRRKKGWYGKTRASIKARRAAERLHDQPTDKR